jgi:hypothetical protein
VLAGEGISPSLVGSEKFVADAAASQGVSRPTRGIVIRYGSQDRVRVRPLLANPSDLPGCSANDHDRQIPSQKE